jgi:hypothetical protein
MNQLTGFTGLKAGLTGLKPIYDYELILLILKNPVNPVY